MAQLGADDVQVDQLAVTFDSTSQKLSTAESTISSLVRSLRWVGPDADVFKTKWDSGMRSQLTNVADRLEGVAKDLRAQAEAQRTASAGDGSGAPVPPAATNPQTSLQEEMAELRRQRAEAMQRLAAADRWADEHGRQQIRDLADASDAEQRAWWDSLTDDQQAALLRNDPGALFGLDGLPADVRAEARADYIDSVRSDLEISSTADTITGELNIAWVHLGVEGSAGIVEQADGTFRVDLSLDGEIGANLGSKGAKGHAGIGAGVSQSYEFDSLEEAEAFVDGLYEKLTPDIDASIFKGPGGLMADTVDDVVGYLGDHSDQRSSFEGELRLEGEVDLDVGAFEVNVSGEAGARYNFDSGETTLFVGGSASGSIDIPTNVEGATASASLSADLEVQLVYDDNGNVSELSLGGTFGGEASVGIEAFLNGTNADSATPETLSMSAAGGADVRFDASLDLQDPIVQQRAADLINSMSSSGGVSMADLQALLRESEVQVQVDVTSQSTPLDLDVGIASLEVAQDRSDNALTWVKPAGGDFTHVPQGELREDRSNV